MLKPFRLLLPIVFLLTGSLLYAVEPWKIEPGKWTPRDCQRLLTDSPWSRPTDAVFALADEETPPQPAPTLPGAAEAGVAGPKSSAPRWDGGVERPDKNMPPVLTVTVRWESALPIRQALERVESASAARSQHESAQSYIVVVKGLVPANQYNRPEINSRSGDGEDTRNPEQMLEGVIHYSRLYPRGKSPLLADDAKLDADGTLRIYFSRAAPIALNDKEVTFETRFGSLSVVRKFRLKDMTVRGNLEL